MLTPHQSPQDPRPDQALQALRDSEERYRRLVEMLPDAMVIQVEGRIVYANPACLRLLGASRADQVEGRMVYDFLPPELVEVVRQRNRVLYEEGRAVPLLEERFLRLDGSEVRVEVIATPFRYQGQPAVQLLAHDVTARRRDEDTVRRSRAALHKLHELASNRALSFLAKAQALLEFGCAEFQLPIGLLSRIHDGRLTVQAARDRSGLVAADQVLPLQDSYCSVTIESAEPVHVEHVGQTPLASHPGYAKSHLETYLAMRVLAGGRSYGTLCFASPEPRGRRFSPADLELLTQMAHWLGSEIEREESNAALAESEHRFRQLAEIIPQVFILSDRSTRQLMYVSPAYEQIWGRSCASLYADPDSWMEGVHPEDRERVGRDVADGRATGMYESEYRVVRPDGSERWVWDRAFEVRTSSGEPYRLAGIAVDITERRQAEEGLMRIQRLLLEAEQLGEIGNWEWDITTGKAYWSNQTSRILGLDPASVMPSEAEFWKRVHPDDVEYVAQRRQHLLAGGRPFSYEHRIIWPNGEVRVLAGRSEVQVDAAGRPIRAIGVVQDVTERRRAEAERARLLEGEQQYRGQLQALSRRLVELQEQERRGLARELHDEIGQLLTGLKFMLEGTAADARPDGRLEQAQSLLNELLARVRNLSMSLRPAMLDDLGLLPALLWLIGRFQAQTGLQIAFTHTGMDGPLPADVATAAYRIVQEALTNVARHARAPGARVALRIFPGRLLIQIEDKGVGFDSQRPATDSSGLTGMRERALLLGGTLGIDSAPGEGTIVRVELPLPDGGASVRSEP